MREGALAAIALDPNDENWPNCLASGLIGFSYVVRLGDVPTLVSLSESCRDLLGVDAAKLLADPDGVNQVVPRSTLAAAHQASQDTMHSCLNHCELPTGNVLWLAHQVAIRPQPDGDTLLLGIAQDWGASARMPELSIILDLLPGASIFVFDTDLRFLLVRGGALASNAVQPEDYEGRLIQDCFPPDRYEFYREFYGATLAGKEMASEVTSPDGQRRYQVRTRPVRDAGGQIIGGLSVATDVTELRQAQEQLALSQRRFRLVAENSNDLVTVTDPEGIIQWISPSAATVLGWSDDEMVGLPWSQFTKPTTGATALPGQAARAGSRFRVKTRDGPMIWMERTTREITDEVHGTQMVTSWRDITSQVVAELQLAASERRFRLTMHAAPVGMALIDLDRRLIDVNPALCAMLGRDRDWLLRHRVPDVLDPVANEDDLRLRAEVLSGLADSVSAEHRMISVGSEVIWALHSIGLLRDERGAPQMYISHFVDITQTREAREDLRYLATHDNLTRILNRSAFFAEMAARLAHPQRSGTRMGLLFVDLDDFKSVNDEYGHAVGDEVLRLVAQRLTSALRAEDLVARIGGDEFLIAVSDLQDTADLMITADKLRSALQEEIQVDNQRIRVSISIGGCRIDGDGDLQSAIRVADQAMYRAKATGHGSSEIVTSD